MFLVEPLDAGRPSSCATCRQVVRGRLFATTDVQTNLKNKRMPCRYLRAQRFPTSAHFLRLVVLLGHGSEDVAMLYDRVAAG
eukprot:SAG31_NODE_33171_length_347_cov_0.620968_1_plen_81_part_01